MTPCSSRGHRICHDDSSFQARLDSLFPEYALREPHGVPSRLWPGDRPVAARAGAGDRPGAGQYRGGRPAVLRAGPVRQGGRPAGLGARQAGRRAVAGGDPAPGDLGDRGHRRHRRQHHRLPAGRPHGASPAARRHGDLLRACADAALRLPSWAAFGAPAQDHADRRRPPVRHLAVVLPREPRHLRGAVRHAAAQPVHELAARPAADRADPLLRGGQCLGG